MAKPRRTSQELLEALGANAPAATAESFSGFQQSMPRGV